MPKFRTKEMTIKVCSNHVRGCFRLVNFSYAYPFPSSYCENFCKADKDSGAENNYAKFVEETFNIVVVVG